MAERHLYEIGLSLPRNMDNITVAFISITLAFCAIPERFTSMKKLLPLVLGILAVLIAACDFSLSTDIYMQDVLDAQDNGQSIYTNATVAFQYSSSDPAQKQQVVDLLEQQLNEVSNVHEETRDYGTYLVADFKIPLVYAVDVAAIYGLPEIQTNMFTFAVTKDTANVAFNRKKFDTLDSVLADKFYQHLDFKDFTMSLFLHNDARKSVDVTLYSSYADNAPVPYSQTFTLNRRDDLEVRFSDVLRDAIITPQDTETKDITVRKFADLKVAAE